MPEHPTLNLRLTNEQRDRATSWLQEAYADGRLTEAEFDRRVGQVLEATTRKDLNLAFYGLVDVPRPQTAVVPTSRAHVARRDDESTALGAIAWFGSIFSMFIVPLVMYLVSVRGSKNRAITADALNFQLFSMLFFTIGGALVGITNSGVLAMAIAAYGVIWLVLSIIGGLRAANGDSWRNPVTRLVRFQPLKD